MSKTRCMFPLLTVALMLALLAGECEARKRKQSKDKDYPSEKQLELQRKETTPVDFTRLLVMRLVYGVAKMMGFEDSVGSVLGGALVPPGADDDDDFDLFDDDDY